MTVGATYRLQLHSEFTFAEAAEIIPYLESLGISHVYASPITQAQPGSTHGYDVADPTRIGTELGGEEGFRSLVAALRARGMGIIIDIVPNHMGISGDANPWWNDVLAKGPESQFATYFDIDWREKLILPFLATSLEQALADGVLEVRQNREGTRLVAYGSASYPLREEDRKDIAANGLGQYGVGTPEGRRNLAQLLERQHYRLTWWRTANDRLNWRRFFTISELAGLRIEDDAVFAASHALYFRLYEEGLIDGVRVDHVDGLTDPAGYCRKLRNALDARRSNRPEGLREHAPYIVIEKILAADEPLSPDWRVDGTSGYDFMEEVSALLHTPEGEASLGMFWARLSGRSADFAPEDLQARRDMLDWEFEGQLESCVEAFAALAASAPDTSEWTLGMLRRAVSRLLWVFPVYRTYGTGSDAPASDEPIRRAVLKRVAPFAAPGEGAIIEAILDWLAGDGAGDPALAADAVRRFQQLSAPIAAKAVEDTAFYRFGRLLSRNDVGFNPERFSMGVNDFHAAMIERRAAFPDGMLATATHDHKRGEDVRARVAAISEVPGEWIANVERWIAMTGRAREGVFPADVYQLLQTIYGAWPAGVDPDDTGGLGAFAGRVADWQEKAVREAKLRSSWTEPDLAYEAAARRCAETLLDPAHSPEFLAQMHGFVARMAPSAEANGLIQTVLRCTVPGVPDTYQGAEFADLSLVDPDNRRSVDYGARIAALEQPGDNYDHGKQQVLCRILAQRRALPDLWARGSYDAIAADGPRSSHVLAFAREYEGSRLVIAAALRCFAELSQTSEPAEWWGDTRLCLPRSLVDGAAHDVLAEAADVSIPAEASLLFASSPVRVFLL